MTMQLEEAIDELSREFLDNFQDDIDFLEGEIFRFQDSGDKNILRSIFAKVHSSKGTAGALGLNFICKTCHIFEDHLSESVSNGLESQCDTYLKFIDLLREYLMKDPHLRQSEIAELQIKLDKLKLNKEQRRLLVVQKTKSFLKRYQQILEDRGVEISTATDGYEALGRILKEDFDVMLCDASLPIINGKDLVKMLRMIPHKNPYIKIILSTSSDGVEEEYVPYPDFMIRKDIDYFQNIRRIFSEIFDEREIDLPTSSANSGGGIEALTSLERILCIDDDEMIRTLVKLSLASLELKTFATADTAANGIKLLKEGSYDLVLLDYILEDKNGPEVFKEIHALNPNIPVVFLTGRSSPSDIEFLKNLGAAGIIVSFRRPYLEFSRANLL